MVKIFSANSLFCSSEQYSDCSSLLKADEPPLEELDPAILSCGLPAIILSDVQPIVPAPTRYSFSQLLALRKSALSFHRPAAADDPRTGRYSIWKSSSQLKKGCLPYVPNPERKNDRGNDMISNNKDKTQERLGNQKHHYNRENGFIPPRYRRNYEFSNRNHHVIVKNYRGDDCRLQDTVIEEEPEWVTSGPTSRLDTIELRGFDEDVSLNTLSTSQSSLEKAVGNTKSSGNSSSEKHISFYDELHHYEHVHPKRGSSLPKHDSSGRENDVESVATCASNTSSPPPARSTPTKNVLDYDNSVNDKMGENHQKPQHNGVNVNNFEEFMKFDSFLSTDSAPPPANNQPGSRFSKWFRRGNGTFNQSTGSAYDGRRQSYYSNSENFGNGYSGNNRYQYDRNQQQHQRFSGTSSYNRGFQSESVDQNNHLTANPSIAFKQLVDMVAHSRASSNLLAQQQYLMQLLSKNQQSEILRRMLMKNNVDNVTDANQQQQVAQQPRIPTQRELQFHTQTIMQNALLRKKLQDQRKLLFEQNNQMTATVCNPEPNPAVQQFVQSVCPNMQRSLSVLSQTVGSTGQCRQFNHSFGADGGNNPIFSGGPTQHDLSASLQQMLLPSQQNQRSAGSYRRFGKGSVTWNNVA